ncbi:MAG: TolC family protein [Ferruginibacter sp.]
MKHLLKKMGLLVCWLGIISPGSGQTLTIDHAYEQAKQHYPLSRQRELIKKARDYSIENISKGYLPQFSVNGQATYQSDVTQVPIKIPGMELPVISKDQYRIYGEVTQSLYNGGILKDQARSQELNAVVEEQKLEADLYKLKESVNQLFFGILLIDEQIKQTSFAKSDIQSGINKAQAAVDNGTALKSSVAVLKAELLKTDQKTIELKAARKAYMDMLGLFLNQQIDDNTVLTKPNTPTLVADVKRPELLVFTAQRNVLDLQDKMLSSRNLPKVNLFLQGGYGRPALNMLSNKFEAYYIGGVRLNWSLAGLYTIKKDKALVDINRRSIELQKETFLLNTNIAMKQQDGEINKYKQLLQTDNDIIPLREEIKNTALAQLQNGVINSNDYLREVNAEDLAKQNKILHEIQLLVAQYNQKTTSGN